MRFSRTSSSRSYMEAIANADLSAEVVLGLHEHDLAALGEDLHDLLHGED